MHVVFVCYYSFACNSAGHIACLANALTAQGVKVTAFVPFDALTATLHGKIAFECRTFDELDAWVNAHGSSRRETIVVAWTPRENVRRFVSQLCSRLNCPYVVHLEDNEKLLTAGNLGLPFAQLAALPPQEIDRLLAVDDRLSHPLHFPRFIANAHGVTALMATLLEFAAPLAPHLIFWPGYNPAFFGPRPLNIAGRHALGIPDDTLVLVYPGNVHSANQGEVRSLYLAACLLNRRGVKALLLRTGEDYVPVVDHTLDEVARHVISLGKLRTQDEVAQVMAMANVFVQPGHAGAFNDYRFPSKLPEFFAIGRPVLIPATNLGRYVRDGEDAVVLHRGDAFEIARNLEKLVRNPETVEFLAENACAFAERHFQWAVIASRVKPFYETVLEGFQTALGKA